jgi:hypothetical protein
MTGTYIVQPNDRRNDLPCNGPFIQDLLFSSTLMFTMERRVDLYVCDV